MKICFLGYRFHPSHFEAIRKITERIAIELKDRGIEVFFISFGPRDEILYYKDIKFYFIGVKNSLFYTALLKIKKYVDFAASIIYEEEPQVVHDHFALSIAGRIITLWIFKKLRMREKKDSSLSLVKTVYNYRFKLEDFIGIILDIRNTYKFHYIFYDILPQLLLNNYLRILFLKGYRHLITIGSFWKKEFKHPMSCRYIPLGIEDKNDLQTNEEEFLRFSKFRNLFPKGKKIIIYMGHFSYSKGIDYLILSMPEILKRNKDVIFVFARSGFGLDRQSYIRKMNRLRIPPSAYYFLGIVDPKIALAASDIFVMPLVGSWGATAIPLSILEALACGSLIITTSVGDISNLITDGYNGFLIRPRNVKALSNAVNKVLALSTKEIDNIRKNAKRSVKNYSWGRIINMYEKFYREVK